MKARRPVVEFRCRHEDRGVIPEPVPARSAPLAATVRLDVRDHWKAVVAGWAFDRPRSAITAPWQVDGDPYEPLPPLKFHNDWTVRTPPGWSGLFVPPLNRPSPSGPCVSQSDRSPVLGVVPAGAGMLDVARVVGAA